MPFNIFNYVELYHNTQENNDNMPQLQSFGTN